MQEEAQRPTKKVTHSSYLSKKVKVTPDSQTTAATANQPQPKAAPKKTTKKAVKKAPKKAVKKAKKPVARSFKQLGNNPYAQVPVKSNSSMSQAMMKARNVSPSSGFSFPGAV